MGNLSLRLLICYFESSRLPIVVEKTWLTMGANGRVQEPWGRAVVSYIYGFMED